MPAFRPSAGPRLHQRPGALRRLLVATTAAGVALAFAAPGASAADLSEDFDPGAAAGQAWTPAGWTQSNQSSPLGLNNWFQGNPPSAGSGGPFDAHQGAAASYIAANYNSVSGVSGTISNWLISPQITTLTNGDEVSFYTRTADEPYVDRLELRLSSDGTCDPGVGPSATGSFSTLLLTVNPTLTVTGYPKTWTKQTAVVSGLPSGTAASGCVGFRYSVPNVGPATTNGNYIGIDTFRFVEDVVAPVAPTVSSLTPSSPGNDNAPKATGTAEAASTVRIYGDSACTGTVLGTGTAAAFNGGAGVAFTVADDATVTPYATATDDSGNVSACSAAGPTYVEDSIAPVTGDDVPTGWQTAPPAVTLTASDGNDVAHTYYEVGTDPAVPTAASSEYDPAHKPTLDDGQRIRYFSVDAAGNAEAPRSSDAAKVDLDAPVTADDVPAGWVATAPTVTLDATDPDGSGVAHVYYEVGTDPDEPTAASSEYDPADKPTLNDGERIRYFSVDAVGRAETPRSSDAAQVDLVAPVTADDVTTGTAPGAAVSLSASDAGSGVATTYFTTGPDPAVPTADSREYDPANRPVLAAGERIRYFSVDAVGNVEAPRSSAAVPIPPAPIAPASVGKPAPQPTSDVAPQPQPKSSRTLVRVTQVASDARCLGAVRGARREITVRYTTIEATKLTLTLQRRVTRSSPAAPTGCPAVAPEGAGPSSRGGKAIAYATVTAGAASRAVRGARKLVLTRTDKPGKQTLPLLRTFGIKAVAPGRYRLRIQPTNADGSAGRTSYVHFGVLAARR